MGGWAVNQEVTATVAGSFELKRLVMVAGDKPPRYDVDRAVPIKLPETAAESAATHH